MIGTIKISVNAAHPNLALQPLYAFVGSPSNLRILDVPKKIGNWCINAVYVNYNYPDNSNQTVPCVLVGGAYVCTLPACEAVGKSVLGYSVIADGVDENGDDVTGYILGKGDVVIMDAQSAVDVGVKALYVNLLPSQPDEPKEGDMWQNASGDFVIWQDGEAVPLGMTAAEVLDLIDGRLAGFVQRSEFDEALQAKQDALSADQIAAIDQKLYEMQTHIVFSDNTRKDALIVGTFNSEDLDGKRPVSVKLGNSVTSIGTAAFQGHSGLTSVTIPDSVKSIEAFAFYYCSGLTSVTIPNSVTSIGEQAFYYSGLTSVTIPDSVTTIGNYAFGESRSLSTVTIHAKVTNIGRGSFNGCTSLTSVAFIGKTLAQVQAMANYPWGISPSIITTWNDASQEWVSVQLGDIETILNNL